VILCFAHVFLFSVNSLSQTSTDILETFLHEHDVASAPKEDPVHCRESVSHKNERQKTQISPNFASIRNILSSIAHDEEGI